MRKVPCKKKKDSPGGTRTCTLQKQQKLNARPFPLCTIKNLVPATKLTDRAFKYHRTHKKKDKPAIFRSQACPLQTPGVSSQRTGQKKDVPVPCPARCPQDLHPLALVHTSTSGRTHEIRTFLNAKVYHVFQGEKT